MRNERRGKENGTDRIGGWEPISDWVKICSRATKVVTFIDLAGHEKYLKTTVFGMTGHAPDFSMLMVSHYIPPPRPPKNESKA